MKCIEKIKFINFKRFEEFEYSLLAKRNLLIGDNEAGKSSILQAIDLVLGGSRTRVETIGLETIFNQRGITNFLASNKSLDKLPKLSIEIYLSDQGNMDLEGLNNSDEVVCQGLKLNCEPIDEYGPHIQAALADESALFPFEFYSIKFTTFSGLPYTQNHRYVNHVLIDSSLIGSDLATRIYTKSLYEAHTDILGRHRNNHAYRLSKAVFTENSLAELNTTVGNFAFRIKNDSKSSLDLDLMITEYGIPISQMGKGKQCFIKTEFALQQKRGKTPIDLILIEEPENHLSHLNMQRLINLIEESTQTQMLIATHSSSVCSRLDLHNAFLLGNENTNLVSLANLSNETANYFVKAPNNKILEFILSPKVILVEGDSEYMLLEGMYLKIYNEKLENSNIHIISVGGTSFKRYLELARLLGIKVAVIRDNDEDFQGNCIDNYADFVTQNIQIFYDQNNDRPTFEICVYEDNPQLCNELFSAGRRTLPVKDFMLKNKTESALNLLSNGMQRLVVPDYIARAMAWIKE